MRFLAVCGCFTFLISLAHAESPPIVLAGGVSGSADLVIPGNSTSFRASGGGLYLHNNGWSLLNGEQRKQVLSHFKDRPLAIELGFKPSGHAWGEVYRKSYLPFALRPSFIAANAFAGNNHPTPEGWKLYMDELHAAGVPAETMILPTFEYANFSTNIPTLSKNKLSDRTEFQEILTTAGGIVIDSPSGYFFTREQNYRDWVVDALKWCGSRRLHRVVIVSPHIFGKPFPEDTRRFISYLRDHDALPEIWVCENYTTKEPETYINRVGSENNPTEILGTARLMLQEYLAPQAATR